MKKAALLISLAALVLCAGVFYTACTTSAPSSSTTPMPTPIATAGNNGIVQAAVVLGTSARFAVLSNQSITDVPTSSITGDVGLDPGVSSSCGLLPVEVHGTGPNGAYAIYVYSDSASVQAMLDAARADALSAYGDATNLTVRGTPTSISGDLNGLTLAPGLYESGSSIQISPGGILYLDGQGNANAVFVIISANTITTESTSAVVLAGSAQAKNVFWAAGSAITLGTNSTMKGTLIAGTSISLLTGASLQGRALIQGSQAGSITLDSNTIVLP